MPRPSALPTTASDSSAPHRGADHRRRPCLITPNSVVRAGVGPACPGAGRDGPGRATLTRGPWCLVLLAGVLFRLCSVRGRNTPVRGGHWRSGVSPGQRPLPVVRRGWLGAVGRTTTSSAVVSAVVQRTSGRSRWRRPRDPVIERSERSAPTPGRASGSTDVRSFRTPSTRCRPSTLEVR